MLWIEDIFSSLQGSVGYSPKWRTAGPERPKEDDSALNYSLNLLVAVSTSTRMTSRDLSSPEFQHGGLERLLASPYTNCGSCHPRLSPAAPSAPQNTRIDRRSVSLCVSRKLHKVIRFNTPEGSAARSLRKTVG